MKLVKKKKNNHLQGNSGVALIMVLGAITILTAVLVTFTFDTKLNKIRVYNYEDKAQAKLNAESGITLAMARLRLYQEALNLLEKDKNMKKLFDRTVLNHIWNTPFVYPIPIGKEANLTQKEALQDFEDNFFLKGKLSTTTSSIGQLMPINLLRLKKKKSKDDNQEASEGISGFQKELTNLLKNKLEEERESNEDFETVYPNYKAEMFIKMIKYYVSDPQTYEDADYQEIENMYDDITPKFAPLSSLSELYLVKGLNDAVIDLIKNNITAHGNKSIDLNQITKGTLRLVFPDITKEQITEFFKYRDDPEEPHPFLSLDDFQRYVVTIGQIVDKGQFDKRITELKKAGIGFGVTISLFKISSIGQYSKTSYVIKAIVSIPTKPPPPPPKPKKPNQDGKCPPKYQLDREKDLCIYKIAKKKKDEELPVTYLPPRIVEMEIN